MIVEALATFVVDALLWVLTTVGGPPVPAFMSTAEASVQAVMDQAQAFGSIVPFDVAGQVSVAIGICLLAGVGIKLFRLVLSLATAGGGSAG